MLTHASLQLIEFLSTKDFHLIIMYVCNPMNEYLFPAFIYLLYLVIFLVLFGRFGQKKIVKPQPNYYENCLPKRYYAPSIEKTLPAPEGEKPLTLHRLKGKPNKYSSALYFRMRKYLGQLHRLQLYLICLKLNLEIYCDGEKKPVDSIIREILSTFRASPWEVLAALK